MKTRIETQARIVAMKLEHRRFRKQLEQRIGDLEERRLGKRLTRKERRT